MSSPLLPGPLWPGVGASEKVLSMDWIEKNVYNQMTDVKLWLLYYNTWNNLSVCKKELRVVSEFYKQNIFTNQRDRYL